MKVRLDAGALARFLGHAEAHARAPEDLSDELIIATLDVSPFLVSEQPGGSVGYQITPGRGYVVRKNYGAVTAGQEFLVTVPAGEAWRPLLFFIRLVTNATVATRYTAVILDDGDVAQPFYRDAVINGQAASTSWDNSWGLGALTREDTGQLRQVRPFPDVALTPGMRIRTNIVNLQAGDQITVANLLYESL